MPLLPSIEVSQVHYDRIAAALAGTTPAQKEESFRVIVINALIEHVEHIEIDRVESGIRQQRDTAIAQVQATMPARFPYPPNFSTPAAGD